MTRKYNIRNLYAPVQPSVKITDEGVSYTELSPDVRLQEHIYCYWNLKTSQPLDDVYKYQVVSDGCIDVFFDLPDCKEIYVMGFCNSYTAFDVGREFNYFGIRFLPGVFSSLFNINASELTNRSEPLERVQADLYYYIRSLLDIYGNIYDFCNNLNNYFLGYTDCAANLCDNRFSSTLAIILNKKGLVDVEKDLNDGVSSRHLRRLFSFYIGDTAKSFCRVIRFQNLLMLNPSVRLLKEEKLFYDLGYYDQTHFIKEFKLFYGMTPRQAFAE